MSENEDPAASIHGDGDESRIPALSSHILPTSGTMVGVCTTLIGLVKIAETKFGPSHIDESAALVALVFVASAIASYGSIRCAHRPRLGARLERAADILFLAGLLALALVAVFFAYEVI